MQEPITQAMIDEVAWYHEFDFGNGLKTRPTLEIDFHRKVWKFIESQLDAIDFKGKTVLDIGCWDGYWSFYAEKRGASEVLASDDVTQNWAGGNGLRLAKQLLGSKVEVNQRLPVYDLASLGRRFDIVLCLGVYYHLIDPFYALAQIRHCATRAASCCSRATAPPRASIPRAPVRPVEPLEPDLRAHHGGATAHVRGCVPRRPVAGNG